MVFGDHLTGVGGKEGKNYIMPIQHHIPSDCHHLDGYEVLPETVGQYTGLKENTYEQADLNKPIYDGDIVEFIDGRRLFVLWNDDTCQFEFSDGLPINSGEYYYCHKRIIGNIHDNPEILK